MDTNNIKQQLKKYKIQLHELKTALDETLEREQRIFNAEQQRIAYKTQEFREDCTARSTMIKQEQMQLMETLSGYTDQLAIINQELADLQGHKFKLRFEVLNKIHAENRAKKDVRRNREVFSKQLTDLNNQITTHDTCINNYETLRRQINEDYYNWKTECEETTSRINTLLSNDRKREILQTYLDELSNDYRASPEQRYDKLDHDITTAKQQIEQLGYQYSKLQNYMKTFTESIPAQKELAISSYLKTANSRIPILNTNKHKLIEQIKDTQTRISSLECNMQNLAVAPLPTELIEQTCRANQRLEISSERSHSEYDPLITTLKNKIMDLDNQLASEIGNLKLLDTFANSSLNTPINNMQTPNTIPAEANEIDSSVNTSHLQLPDFTGKSRKEIERLKKQKLMAAVAIL